MLVALLGGWKLSLFDDLTNVVFLNLPRKNIQVFRNPIFFYPVGKLASSWSIITAPVQGEFLEGNPVDPKL